MYKKTVYIVTPCKNAAETIEDTIQSVINQEGDFFINYHVQDSKSTDNTILILEKYYTLLKNNNKIKFTYSSEKDSGMYDGINKAFFKFCDIDQESFMGWINADDILLPNTCTILCSLMHHYPDITWCGGMIAIRENNHTKIYPPIGYQRKIISAGLCDGKFFYFIQQEGTFWKKKLWDKVGGLDASFRLAGDWDLWRRMAAYSSYIQIDTPMGIFTKRAGQLSENLDSYYREINNHCSKKVRRSAALKISFQYLFSKKNNFYFVYQNLQNIISEQVLSKDKRVFIFMKMFFYSIVPNCIEKYIVNIIKYIKKQFYV